MDSIRIGSRVWLDAYKIAQPEELRHAIAGQRNDLHGPAEVETVSDLEGAAAVVLFALEGASRSRVPGTVASGWIEADGVRVEVLRTTHAGLAQLLRERPEDRQRITAYDREHGPILTAADMPSLLEWLAADINPNLDEGWL